MEKSMCMMMIEKSKTYNRLTKKVVEGTREALKKADIGGPKRSFLPKVRYIQI